jgi:hypothetical protein
MAPDAVKNKRIAHHDLQRNCSTHSSWTFPIASNFVLYRTWENLLAGHAVLLNGVILQLVLGKGQTWSPP